MSKTPEEIAADEAAAKKAEEEALAGEASALEMSDEDFLKQEEPGYIKDSDTDLNIDPEEVAAEEARKKEQEALADPDNKDDENKEDEDNPDADADNVDPDEDDPDKNKDLEDPDKDAADKDKGGEDDPDADDPEKDNKGDEVDNKDDIDYKSAYEVMMAPFKANDTTLQPKSPEDVVRLMQMGANYHKKMAGLKPSMKTLKLLEKNGLMDPEKLNYLIDLNNKDPKAITQLLKDSEIDPLTLDLKEDVNYKPTSRTVSDTEVDLDMVLNTIKGTQSYDRTLNVITEKWDDKSRDMIAAAPEVISTLNEHIANGTYDKVMGVVDYERTMGRLVGIPDLEAYRQTGESMLQAGKLDQVAPKAAPKKVEKKPKNVKPKTDTDASQRKEKKKAAAPTGHGGKTDGPSAFNPLEMSDEEIEKFDEKDLPKA